MRFMIWGLCVSLFLFLMWLLLFCILPTRSFFKVAGAAIDLFNMLNDIAAIALERGQDLSSQMISIHYDVYHYEFENIEEGYQTVEKLCKIASNYYNILVNRNIATVEVQTENQNLSDISRQLRIARWKKT